MSDNPLYDAKLKEIEKLEKQLQELEIKSSSQDKRYINSIIEETKYEQAFNSSYGFLNHSWSIIEGAEFIHSKASQAIGEHLDACLEGQIKRLIINVSPRTGKSILVNKTFPAYAWIKKPELKFANVSYSDDLAVEGAIDSKKIILSEWYQKGLNTVWSELNEDEAPWTISKQNRNLNDDYYNTRNGRRFATSVGGTFTGKGSDIILIDDPLSPKQANSPQERKNCIEWAKKTLSSRLDDKINGVFILIMQRLHMEDLAQYYMDTGNWEILKIPLEWDESKRFWTSLGWTDWRKENGESADPVRFPKDIIETVIKPEAGDDYSAQYLQEPVPEGGGKIKTTWWNQWYVLPQAFHATCMAFDLNTKKGDRNDNTALVVVGRKDDSYYVIDLVYANMDIADQLEAITNLCAKYPYIHKKLIEDKSNGSAVWTLLHKTIPGLEPVDPKGIDKELRITASLVPKLIKNSIYLPPVETHPWVKHILEESKYFPRGKHEDSLDALSYSINYLDNNNSYTVVPYEVITEDTKHYISRQDIRRKIGEVDRYNNIVRPNHDYLRGLFN